MNAEFLGKVQDDAEERILESVEARYEHEQYRTHEKPMESSCPSSGGVARRSCSTNPYTSHSLALPQHAWSHPKWVSSRRSPLCGASTQCFHHQAIRQQCPSHNTLEGLLIARKFPLLVVWYVAAPRTIHRIWCDSDEGVVTAGGSGVRWRCGLAWSEK